MNRINYYFWGVANRDNPEDVEQMVETFAPDWAWAEWAEEQGIGE